MTEEEAKKRLAMIAKKQELLGKAVGILQEKLFEAILNQLETIAENPAALNRLFDEFTQNEHSKVLQNFGSDIISIGAMNAEYFIEAAANIGSKKYQAIQAVANDQILQRFGLDKSGKMVKGGFIDSFANDQSIKRQLIQYAYKAKTSGAGLQEFKAGFKDLIIGSPDKNGALLKYYNTFAYDTYQQVDSALQEHYSKELGLEAFLYLGGLIAGSRPFCNERNGKVFLKKEIDAWKKLEFAGKPSNYTPFLDRGGYNCRHILNAITNKMAVARRSDLEIDEDGQLRVKGTAPRKPTPEADTKAPEAFKPAESIEEAKNDLISKGIAKDVDFGKLPLTEVNTIKESLEWVNQRYNVKQLDVLQIRTMKANVGGHYESIDANRKRALVLNESILNKNLDEYNPVNYKAANKKQLDQWQKSKTEKPELFEGNSDSAKKNRKAFKAIEEASKYDRWTVQEAHGKGAIVTHEIGHQLQDNIFGLGMKYHPNTNLLDETVWRGFKKDWESVYKQSVKSGDIYKVSEYAALNAEELFAESFTMLRYEPSKLPIGIKSKLEEILKYAAK